MDQPEELPEVLQQIQRHAESLLRLLNEPNLNSMLWNHQTASHIRRIVDLADPEWWMRKSQRTDIRLEALSELCSWATNNRFNRSGDLDQLAELRTLIRAFQIDEDEARDRTSFPELWLERLQDIPEDKRKTIGD